jgi:hypothetical protein
MSLAHLQRFCEEQRKEPLELTTCDLRDFREGLLWRATKRGHLYSANTVDLALRITRHFYRWALAGGQLAHDPTADWILPAVPQPERPVLSSEQVARLFNLTDLADPLGPRDQLILELLYTLGWTFAKCLSYPVEWDSELELVRPAWERYLVQCRPYLEREPVPVLILTCHGQPFHGVMSLQKMLQRYGQRLDLPFALNLQTLHRTRRRLEDSTRRRLPLI